MSKPHGLRWVGAGLACLGVLSLLYACALLAWQYTTRVTTGNWVALPVAGFVPHLPPAPEALTWALEHVHIGVPFAVIGFVLLAIGVVMVLRQNEILRIEERAAADRLRRVRLGQYGDPERREPYIGSSIPEIPERTRKAA